MLHLDYDEVEKKVSSAAPLWWFGSLMACWAGAEFAWIHFFME